ncbi:MAG: Asp-tRNA(Asn)/Glu-tRNA(Gln) amidotransferase GatCAB subunit C, partial [Clostridiales bacterium]|nr:Asp-tRNA(Asn)/Glu-tRNA(Gln) amidotransferase GatCAB subunit C [Clostridiales bacterium]
ARLRMTDDGAASSFPKFMSEAEMTAILQAAGAETGDVVFIIADANRNLALSVLGALRGEAAKRLGLIDDSVFHPLWVVDIPFFELDEESGEWVAMHHPFTSPKEECLDMLDGDKGKVYAKAWDLVLNGVELSSGSIRITDPALQSKIFDMLGFTQEEAQEKFGYLLDAFRYGAPPHGGMGIGLDRLVMQMLCAPTLRDVTAFPKMQNASELMTECPAPVEQAQLDELGLKLTPQTEKAEK